MAFKKVDAGPMPEAGNFVQLKQIGEKLVGLYVGVGERENNFGRKQNDYTLRNKDGLFTISANYDLDRQMKAAINEGLKPGMPVIMKYTHDLPPKKADQSPMRCHEVSYDPDYKPSAKPAAPAPKPPPPPAPAADDPFAGLD